ncbi:MAG: MMPL family transporter, partial [Gemmatimonadetes bacterium]|nr:MMPL family transporter [Gemmatimonadota bacterium]
MTTFSMDRPKTVIALSLLLTILFGIQFPRITIDADPENMLEADQPDRVFYNRVKEEFGIHDLIVVGIVDEEGVFRPEALERIARATSEILRIKGVIIEELVSPSTTDNVKSAAGLLDIRPVLREVPGDPDAARGIRADVAENPFLHEKIASADGTAVALYVPIERKDMSYRIAADIREILDRELLPGQAYHLAGLPVAEDTFGDEMFIQMAIVAPLAFMLILLIVLALFRQLAFLVPIGFTAMLSVVWAMGLLIGMGFTVHIMSSMIPVFLMPIAILDDVHILSEFFDRYRVLGDKRRAVLEAMRPLYKPMLYTSLTSAVGFASLALADIP